MDKTIWTNRCKLCDHRSETVCYGIWMPLAEHIGNIRFFAHIVRHHPEKLLSIRRWGYFVLNVGLFLLVAVLCLLRALSYVFYPVYILLRLLYGE